MSHGDGRPTTMAVGSCMEVRGRGGLDQSMAVSIVQSGRLLTFPSTASAVDSDLVMARSDGFQSVLVTTSIRGGEDSAAALVSRLRATSVADFRRFMAETDSRIFAWPQ